jgi:hypothetical protein
MPPTSAGSPGIAELRQGRWAIAAAPPFTRRFCPRPRGRGFGAFTGRTPLRVPLAAAALTAWDVYVDPLYAWTWVLGGVARRDGRRGDGRVRAAGAHRQSPHVRVVVVGVGVGGLCAAIELAHADHRVGVLEQCDAPGGQCARVARGGYRCGAGPSLLTLPHVFDDLFIAGVVLVWPTLGLPPLLAAHRGGAVAPALVRLLAGVALALSYAVRGPAYLLSPLADPLAAIGPTASSIRRPNSWPGRTYA